jgi:hypothetical protein
MTAGGSTKLTDFDTNCYSKACNLFEDHEPWTRLLCRRYFKGRRNACSNLLVTVSTLAERSVDLSEKDCT